MTQRSTLEDVVAERAFHTSLERARTTCSFARAERLLGREYHGRFLIELLQNAADAWRADARASRGSGRVQVLLTDEPALLVANEGAPISAEVVISALGHIGASPKPVGEAIGHKGIGFKSVLEVSDAPEIYSALQSPDPLAIAFHPDGAAEAIRQATPQWDEYLGAVDNVDPDDLRTWVPVLRYPTWVDQLPRDVAELASGGYDTVVRLPLVAPRDGTLSDTVAEVQRSIADVSDEILLLLASIGELTIVDRARGINTMVRPEVLADDGDGEHVQMLRDGQASSAWRLYRDSLDEVTEDLSSELTVGVRIHGNQVRTVGSDPGGAPFHLFFPTRIPSGTPLLLHGYFEVDAARTGFYGGSGARNRAILDGLAVLAARAVDDTLTQQPDLAVSMAVGLAEPTEPADPLARDFRARLLDELDAVAWVPIAGSAVGRRVRPGEVLALPELNEPVQQVFPATYVEQRTGHHLPHAALPVSVLHLVRSRQGDRVPAELDAVEELLLPGELEVWRPEEADDGFRALLDLLDALRAFDRSEADELLERLRGDSASRIIPTVSSEGMALHPCADPAGGRPGEVSRVIMARVRRVASAPLAPPSAFDIDFLPDALLASEEEVDRARPLGVRPFTVDTVLDRLGAIDPGEQPEEVLTFLWRLLDREQASSFGIRRSAEIARVFDPAGLFWCQPRRNLDQETGVLRQRRERNLTTALVPCRDGAWRPAGHVALGADWADWIEDRGVGSDADRGLRAASLRAIEGLAPGDKDLLASPDRVQELLDPSIEGNADASDDVLEDATPLSSDLRMLAFLLRLGVWQVLPVEAWDDLSIQGRRRRPWPGTTEDLREEAVATADGWTFESRPGRPHSNVWIGDDFRFLWPLETLANHDARLAAHALSLGLPLYRQLQRASAFCPNCSDDRGRHTARHRSGREDRFPSHLAIELHHHRWVPVERGGEPLPVPAAPARCWWGPEAIGSSVLRQSPDRFLDRTNPSLGVTEPLSRVAGIDTLNTASTDRLGELLETLRTRHGDPDLGGELASSGLARQAFVGLHRRVYLRLADHQVQEPDEVAAVITSSGVLCERGNQLVYVPPGEARHDDGTHASHLRYFADELARVVLPRDATEAAKRLGIPPLVLTFDRRGGDAGDDVTAQVTDIVHDRVPELLAILVHHSQGTRTLEPTSTAFEQRAQRLQRLTIRQLRELVLDVRVAGTDLHEIVGEGRNDDIFLEAPTSVAPVLYHDLTGPDWREGLRRHLAPHVAALVENSAYEHTFEAFFNREGATEREHFLLSLGIRPEDVDHVADRVGTVSDDARRRRQRWFAAIASNCGRPTHPTDVDLDQLQDLLAGVGLASEDVDALLAIGGGTEARRDASTDGALARLTRAGLDLEDLDGALREMGDEGIAPGVAAARFRTWRDTNRWPLVAVLAPRIGTDEARGNVQELRPPTHLRLALDPPVPALLEPVVALLGRYGLQSDAADLAADPLRELARVAGHDTVNQLQQAVATYADTAAWQRELRARAASWRDVLVDIAILIELPPDATRAHVREVDANVQDRLPHGGARPSDLRVHLDGLLPNHSALAIDLADELTDDVVGPRPSLDQVASLATRHGVPVARQPELVAARGSSRRRVERLQARREALNKARVRPTVPATIVAGATGWSPPPTTRKGEGDGPVPVRLVKVDPSTDHRKRKAGDEGEQWALAATVADLVALTSHGRERAIDELSAFLVRHFEGSAVDELVEHGVRARSEVEDDEEFIHHAVRMLHVSAVSDAFGFDIIGWLATDGQDPEPVCLEVKSTSGGSFHVSAGEWRRAETLHKMELGHHYAVLAIVRNPDGGAPTRMDVLPDPVALVAAEQLARTVDGYSLTYRVGVIGEP